MAVFQQERKFDFPDHTADDFDPSVVVTHNGIDYVWNGYGWEVVCKGGGGEVPDVGDGELTLKTESGTVLGTFTANQEDGVEVEIPAYDDQWITDDQARQDQELEDYKTEVAADQVRQDDEIQALQIDQQRQDDAFALDQQRQNDELAAEVQARAERDLLHDAQIDTIEYKLEALIGVTFRGTYEFKHDQSCEEEYQKCISNCPDGDARCESDCARAYSECEENSVEPGYFEAIDPDGQFDNLQEIIISKNDKSNVEIDWAGVLDKDDYLEVDHVLQGQLDKTNYGLYRILEEPEAHTNSKGDVVYVMKLQFLQGDGVLNEKEMYEIRGITAAEGVNPEELGDFLTKDDAAALYAPKSHAHKGEDITSGKVSINRLPTGTSSSTVAVGNHGHSGYAGSGHNHNGTYVKGSFTITKSNGNYYIS